MRFYVRDRPRTSAALGWLVMIGAYWIMSSCALTVALLSCTSYSAVLFEGFDLAGWPVWVRVEWLAILRVGNAAFERFEHLIPNVPVSWQLVSASVLFGVFPLTVSCVAGELAWLAALSFFGPTAWLWALGAQFVAYSLSKGFFESLDRYRPAAVGSAGVGTATAWEMEQFGME